MATIYLTFPMLETFSGGDIRYWIPKFEHYMAIYGHNDEDRVKNLRMYLTGDAAIWYHRNAQYLTTWSAMNAAITKAFSPKISPVRVRQQLASLKKEPTETYIKYLHRLEDLVSLLPNPPPVDDLVKYFLCGIPANFVKRDLIEVLRPAIAFATWADARGALVRFLQEGYFYDCEEAESPGSAEATAMRVSEQISQLAAIIEKLTEVIQTQNNLALPAISKSYNRQQPGNRSADRARIRLGSRGRYLESNNREYAGGRADVIAPFLLL